MKSLSFNDITLVPNYNPIASRRDVDTSVMFGNLKLDIPLLSAAMDTITGRSMAREMARLGGLGFLHRFCSIEDNIQMYKDVRNNESLGHGQTVISLGINEGMDRFLALHEIGARYFSIDVAHAHSKQVGKFIKQLKEFDESITLVAGSVCTYAGSDYLSSCGADIIRVGVGPSSVCSTRVKTGFGLSQFTAILECSKVSKPIICDGGIRAGGDCMKAFVAGATYIMCGTALAGSEETPGEVIEPAPGHPKFKTFRGMASKEAQEDFMGKQNEWKTAEGIEVKVPYKGPVVNIVSDLMGGIRSGMTYAGVSRLDEIHRKVDWREITYSGYIEGTPHGKSI